MKPEETSKHQNQSELFRNRLGQIIKADAKLVRSFFFLNRHPIYTTE